MSGFGNQKWIRDNYKIVLLGDRWNVIVYTFDLSSAKQDSHRLQWAPPTNWKPKFESVHAGLMYVRRLGPDENYWWSG